VIIDPEASTVYLSDPLMRLDVGAIAKGYAVEQVAKSFESQGVQHLLVSVGGNVRAIGGKFSDETGKEVNWDIGIQNPDKNSAQTELFSVMISGLSVVSSGIYERYYTVDGVQYHHIINPDTLMPAAYFAQVTIICNDSGLADALSTAIFNMPLYAGIPYIESLPDVEALWVMKDGSLAYSSGFESFMK
jgi:thiamine biosynthesis lipoprotein